MKTTKYFLSMAALALVGAMTVSCSSDDNITDQPQQPVNKNNVVTLTTTVGFADDGTTRALSSTGVKTFAAGETMAVIYNNGTSFVKAVSHALEAGDITNEGKNATFTFDLENPDKSAPVRYIYPAAMAGDTGVDLTKLNTQEGTFDALQSKYDLCTNSGAWDGENLPSLTLENQLAILAITLKNSDGSSDITSSITGLTVGDGTNTYTVNRSAAAGPIYVAILPTSGATITVNATDGSKNYTKTLTDKTYAASSGYNVSWRMTQAAAEGHALSASAVGEIVGTDGKAYDVADKDNLPTGVTAVAMVAYKSGSKGLAIQLNSSPVQKNWDDAKTYAEGLTAVTGGTWRLPSKADWQNMFVGCAVAGDASSNNYYMSPIAGFKAKIAATGITWQSVSYWSSTDSYTNAWVVGVYLSGYNAYAGFDEKLPSLDFYVLGCLAF